MAESGNRAPEGGRPAGWASSWREAATYVLAYLVWLATAAVGVALLLVWLPNLNRLWAAVGLLLKSRWMGWASAAFNNLLALTFALTWLALVVLAESWFRRGVESGRLGRRAVRSLAVEVALAGVGYAIMRLA